MTARTSMAAVALCAVAACNAPNTSPMRDGINTRPVSVTRASDAQVHTFATNTLNALQATSIRNSREYCGYITRSANGVLGATRAIAGGEAWCELPEPGPNVIASYHTHGSYSPVYDNEVPSSDDLRSDFDYRTDGYISTPGGRIWHVDHETRRANLLCGAQCVVSDPGDNPGNAGPIRNSFTLGQILAREG